MQKKVRRGPCPERLSLQETGHAQTRMIGVTHVVMEVGTRGWGMDWRGQLMCTCVGVTGRRRWKGSGRRESLHICAWEAWVIRDFLWTVIRAGGLCRGNTGVKPRKEAEIGSW